MEHTSLPVEQLFDSFKTGDEKRAEKAFAFLFELHYQRLWLFASLYLPEDILTEDIVNESFAKAWGKRKTYHSHDHFLNSLHEITKNACISRQRALKREKKALKEHSDLVEFYENDSDTESIHKQLLEKALNHMGNMSQISRRILTLFYLEGKSIAEIASELKMSREAVSTRKTRALQSF